MDKKDVKNFKKILKYKVKQLQNQEILDKYYKNFNYLINISQPQHFTNIIHDNNQLETILKRFEFCIISINEMIEENKQEENNV